MPLLQLRSLSTNVTASAGSFRLILREPRVRRIVVSSVIARLPKGIVPLATILLLRHVTGSFTVAGAAAALVALGDAATTPAQGRLIDRYGRGRVLLPTAATHVLAVSALLILAHSGAPTPWLILSAGIAGIGMPPVSGCIKAMWVDLVGRHRLSSAYALESLLQQLFFLLGPLLVAGLVVLGGPETALAGSAVLVAGGTIGFVIAAAPLITSAPDVRQRGALRIRTVRVLLLSTLLQSMTFGLLPLGLVDLTAAAGMNQWAGIVQAMLTAGGLLGTFAVPGLAGRRSYVRLVSGFAIVLLPVSVCAVGATRIGVAGVGISLVAAGLFLTPIAALSYVLTQSAVPTRSRTEAFAWLSTGQAIGNAAGAGLAGILTDHGGAALALGAAPVVVAAAAVVGRFLDGPNEQVD